MKPRQEGFSLVEVLVALVVLGTGIAALGNAVRYSSSAHYSLQSRTLAGFVADNQIILARHSAPATGTRSGSSEMAGQAFEWRKTISRAPYPGLYTVQVQVRAKSSQQVLAERTALTNGSPS